jgi:glycopeptide antibiotics resistance protein
MMPLALFLPMLNKRSNTFLGFFMTLEAIIITIELLQFVLNAGFCDIDDVILNTLGAVITYGLLHLPKTREKVQTISLMEY